MSKLLAIAALVGATAIAGCTQGINPTDTDRALIGAGVGATIASVKIDVGGVVVTATITNESADGLGLAAGKDAYAVIKASDVMVGVD